MIEARHTARSAAEPADGIFGEGQSVEPFFEQANGQIRLYLGDSLELLQRCRPDTFDLIFADPPYFLSNDGISCQAGKMVSVNKGMWDRAETFEEVHAFNHRWLEAGPRIGAQSAKARSPDRVYDRASPTSTRGTAGLLRPCSLSPVNTSSYELADPALPCVSLLSGNSKTHASS